MKIKNPLSPIFAKLIYDKRFTVPFSVIAAFIFWLVIMISQNPVRDKTFSDIAVTVPIENSYASTQGLSIVSDISTQKFSVVLSGPNYIVSSVNPEDFLLTAAVEEVNTSGTYSLKIVPSYNSSKGGYSFVSVTPSTIDVTFDYIDTKEYDVVPRIDGVTAADGLIAETPVITTAENSVLELTGPRAVLERISKVEAYAKTTDKLKESRAYDADLILYDEDGNIIYKYATDGKIYDGNGVAIESTSTYMSPSFTSVKVTAPIVKKKIVTLKATFTDRPDGATDSMFVYTANPAQVTIIGAPENVDKIEQISLSAISYKSLSRYNNVFTTTITVPDGLRIENESQKVEVAVDYAATIANIRNKTSGVK